MRVTNIHTRKINQPKALVGELLKTLATENDMMLATDKWSPMRLNNGLEIGSSGGHGPIRYNVDKYIEGELVQFKFTKPIGFNGIHKFEIKEEDNNKTLIKHTIEMDTSGNAIWKWAIAIRWLHDAYIEDAFDKVENYFNGENKISKWSLWVRILRMLIQKRRN